MAGSCNPFIEDPFAFPRKPENRPALSSVCYRVGAYGDFRETLMRAINEAVELRGWTHRAPDDPGIALLEGAAVLGDILTFYQQLYANEAFLRTASWRESIASLTRLLGYRLAPGLGGRATFAFECRAGAPVLIPAGFPLTADLADVPDTVDFQTETPLEAHPQLSRMSLYRRRQYPYRLSAGQREIEIAGVGVGGSSASAAIDRLDLKQGDRLLLMAAEPPWTTVKTELLAPQRTPQVVEVSAVTRRLGLTIVELTAPLAANWKVPATAYRLGRSFRHFGHLAQPTYTTSKLTAGRTITGAREHPTEFERHIHADHACTTTSSSVDLPTDWLPLDAEVQGLTVGRQVVIQTRVHRKEVVLSLTVVRTITGVRAMTMGFGSINGPTTLLTLDSPLVRHEEGSHFSFKSWKRSDIRDYQIHEVTSPAIALRARATHSAAPFTSGSKVLTFFGTHEQAQPLAGRRLVMAHEDGRSLQLLCVSSAADFPVPAKNPAQPRMWRLSLDRPPLPFVTADFDEVKPRVTVFGNVADATQGKAQDEIALGNGDAGSRLQTFKLPKAPLTYLLSAAATPPQVPEVEVLVNGRRWTRVPSLFGCAATDEVYVVREDHEGASYVQFGDGETGARLPSGVQNVSARYRTGSGARGPAKPGAEPSAGRRIDGLDKVRLPGVVTGGADPEPADRARESAPGRVQSLGRLVSVRDYETELLTIPGVTTATAAWSLVDGVPALVLSVLADSPSAAEFAEIRATIEHYGRCRGPDRIPVHVRRAVPRYAFLDLVYARDPRVEAAAVEAGLRSALGLAGDEAAARSGLFGLRNRRLGAPEYLTRVEATCQRVEGVLWCKVAGLSMFGVKQIDPAKIVPKPAPRPAKAKLVPGASRLLQLDPRHLTLTTAPAAGEECP